MPANQPLSIFKSDLLTQLRPFFDSLDELKVFGPIHQFPIIVDSCVVISDLIWLTKHRTNKEARTDLLESVQAETVILFAPNQLNNEVRTHLARISEEQCIPLKILQEKWQIYGQFIQFVEVETESISVMESVRDPKDLPFLQLQQITGYPIYTRDRDIEEMGGKTVNSKMFRCTRDYSREAAVEKGFLANVFMSIMGISILVQAIWNALKLLNDFYRKLPVWVQVGTLCIAFALLLQKPVRDKVVGCTTKGAHKSRGTILKLLEMLSPMIEEYTRAQMSANKMSQELANQYSRSINK